MTNVATAVFLIIWTVQSRQQITMQSWETCVRAARGPPEERAFALVEGDRYRGESQPMK